MGPNPLPIEPLSRKISGDDLEKSSYVLPGEGAPVVTSETSGEHPRYHYSGRAAAEVADLKRSLTARHLALIALASGIGTGLFLGSGSALATAGPLGLLLGYAVMGFFTALIAFMSAETAAFLPISGGFIRFIPMFTDKALGITTGYNFWYLLSITAPAEIVAASSLITYWNTSINLAVWISIFMVVILVFNLLPVRFYGEIEFGFGMLKILLVIGLILAGLIVDWGGSPSGEFIGGKNWHPTPIKEYISTGSTGRFLAFWSVLINAAFAMGNIQIATSLGSECKNPRVDVPNAMRRVFWRILIFYLASLLVVGLILNSDDPRIGKSSGTAGSPFVLAFQTAGIKVLPSIINAVVITSAFSSGNGVLFLASRTLLGLAADGYAPRFLLKTNRFGSPYWAVLLSAVFLPLAYLNCGSDTPQVVFGWFINLIAVAGLNTWIIISVAYLRFYYGLKRQGISRDELPYRSWGQPYAAYATAVFCFLVVFFSGFTVFTKGNFTASGFLSNYINCFILIALYVILKITLKSPWISTDEMDFSEIDAIREERRLDENLVVDPMKRRSFGRRLLNKVLDV